MNRSEFIAAMEAQLIRLPKADRDDILNDYESHFANGVAEGRTEEEVSAQLGNPVELAAVYLENLPEGSKGAPYIPEEPVQQEAAPQPEGSSEQTYRSNEQSYRQDGFSEPAYSYGTVEPDKEKSNEPDAAGIIAVVLLSLFVALPILWSIVGIIVGVFGAVIGCFSGAVAVGVLGVTTMGMSVLASVGLILLAVAVAALGALLLFLGILAVKGTIWLVKWYIGCCKKMIGGTDK